MKNKFNFLQFTNWLFICRENIESIKQDVLQEKITKQDAIEKLLAEKKKISILRDVLDRKVRLFGIQAGFLRSLKDLKKRYGIEE
jgi:hypothetical protein